MFRFVISNVSQLSASIQEDPDTGADMQIIGDRHYKADPGESIRFSLGATSSVGLVVAQLDNALPGPLPVATPGDGAHHVITVTVAFTGNTGGSATILITGTPGHDQSRIRQLTSIPKRSAIFVID
jgi:hypothetical protein